MTIIKGFRSQFVLVILWLRVFLFFYQLYNKSSLFNFHPFYGHPDMWPFTIDWALKTNYLYLYLYLSSFCDFVKDWLVEVILYNSSLLLSLWTLVHCACIKTCALCFHRPTRLWSPWPHGRRTWFNEWLSFRTGSTMAFPVWVHMLKFALFYFAKQKTPKKLDWSCCLFT